MTYSKEINLNGLSTSPSDYNIEDGDLSSAINAYHTSGSIGGIESPNIIFKPHEIEGVDVSGLFDEVAIYKHENDNYCNIIFKCVRIDRGARIDTYGWADFNNIDTINELSSGRNSIIKGDIKSISSIGNTLIVYTEDMAYYFLFRNGSYKFIGSKIPDLEISFSLEPDIYYYTYDRSGIVGGKIADYGRVKVDFPNMYRQFTTIPTYDKNYDVECLKITSDEVVTQVSNTAIGLANQFIGQWCDKNGYFSQPFLARAAFRMYDGSNIMATAPVLMRPSTCANPIIPITAAQGDSMWLSCIGIGCKLCYRICNDQETLEKWSDIINGVDIFVSRPFYTFDQSAAIDSMVLPTRQYWADEDRISDLFTNAASNKFWEHSSICHTNSSKGDSEINQWNLALTKWRHGSKCTLSKGLVGYYSNNKLYDSDGLIVADYAENQNDSFDFQGNVTGSSLLPLAYVLLPKQRDENIRDQIRDCANFYLIKAYKFGDIKYNSSHTEINIDEGVINSLTSRMQLQEDYRSHDTLIPSNVFSYNYRINASDITRYPYEGFSPFSMFQRVNDGGQPQYSISVAVYLRNSSGNIVVRRTDIDESRFSGIIDGFNKCILNYAYYPDSTAYQMDIVLKPRDNGNVLLAKIPLTIHNGLNGSVYFEGIESKINFTETSYTDADEYFDSIPESNNSQYTQELSTIYTSDEENPFVFRAANVEQVGNGKIIAMAPAAQALSSGQFGQYPMYAFTTDGVWALSVSETGGWKSKQPISRDVVIKNSKGEYNKDMILQLDQQVLFATDRGLMLINGSKIECITEIFDGYPDLFVKGAREHLASVLEDYSDIKYEDMPPFREFIRDGNMHYDYKNQRIIIGNSNYRFAYIFNMKDKMWTSEQIQLDSALNSYPDALAVAVHEGKKLLVNLSEKDAEASITPSDGFILTRPLKFDQPDLFKTVRTVIVRGNFTTNTIGPTPGSVDILLYASRDMIRWQTIGSTRGDRLTLHHGTPYKYFRVGIISHLQEGESISGLTIEYELKQTNRMR